jgi:hypothetical protein
MIDEKDFDSALGELFKAVLLEEKRRWQAWVPRELYWLCRYFFQQSKQEKGNVPLVPSESAISSGSQQN